jgi:hypothetical protein
VLEAAAVIGMIATPADRKQANKVANIFERVII